MVIFFVAKVIIDDILLMFIAIDAYFYIELLIKSIYNRVPLRNSYKYIEDDMLSTKIENW